MKRRLVDFLESNEGTTHSIGLLCCNADPLRKVDEHCLIFLPNPFADRECVVPDRNGIIELSYSIHLTLRHEIPGTHSSIIRVST